MSETRGPSDRWRGIGERRQEILNVRREITARVSLIGRFAERIGNTLAAPWFFLVFLIANVAWIVLNLGVVPAIAPWDPPPFMLLATLASVEAPLFAILILTSQVARATHRRAPTAGQGGEGSPVNPRPSPACSPCSDG